MTTPEVLRTPAPPASWTLRSPAGRLVTPLATIAALSATTVALHVRDPHDQGSWGLCPSAALGVWCPGCGGLRAVNDLTRGDVGAALSSNVLVVVLLPVAVVLLLMWTRDRWLGRPSPLERVPARLQRPLVVVTVAVLAAFTVLRNLPFGPGEWLAP
ncbi:DUF2752 domain-containing protein [Nocardioides sp. GY 10127]|uniref:DUF2752 domain-containing protein n=1 Tax=Nocardioides sp. GY 10127 TaxID=2569762 RepID=UPI0010A8A0DD|nr:DUF2752 domain-containing protein [Nocardioides sp. GY 10127]TIC81012.1 DUF2752 domain-containing protein [Nocardioides sp. GY 10127]